MKTSDPVHVFARRFLRCQRGSTIIEFAMVFMLLMMVTFGIVDFGLAFWEQNMAQKGVYQGARAAVQSDPVAPVINSYSAVEDGLSAGQSLDLATLPAFTIRCVEGSCTCSGAGCGTIGTPGYDSAAFNAILQAARLEDPDCAGQSGCTASFAKLQGANLYVEYTHVGQGFAGRPGSDIVPMVTVGVQNLGYDFLVLDAFGFGRMPFASTLVTLPAEDLDSSGAS